MSTHNICFYREISKIITSLSFPLHSEHVFFFFFVTCSPSGFQTGANTAETDQMPLTTRPKQQPVILYLR